MNPTISVIIPVYEVEEYIENTIKSILNQTYKDFEVILVNDGTKDDSINIAERLLSISGVKYYVINQENMGVSAARNIGIKQSNAEWIVCIDSDDIITKDFLKTLYEMCIKYEVDLSISGFKIVNQKSIFTEPKQNAKPLLLKQDCIMKLFLRRKVKIISPAMLMKKSFILENELFYSEDIRFSEDQHFIWKVLLKIEKCVFVPSKLYNYYIRENSTMTSSGIDKILTGFNGFQTLSKDLCSNMEQDVRIFILSRWILGSLRASSKMLSYHDFLDLAAKMEYKKNTKNLILFPNLPAKIMYLILIFDLRTFYEVNKRF